MIDKMHFLRDYQQDMVDRVHEAWNCHRSVMVQMPTGTGKTHVLAHIVAEFPGKVLIVAHRVELVEQIRETILKLKIENEKLKNTDVNSHKSEIINQKSYIINHKSEIQVSSIQTVSRRIDELEFMPDLVIIDEAHHALARTYRILWEIWPEAKFLGLTATPCRMNHAGFTDLFDVLVESESVADFIRKGVLSAFDYVSIRPDSVDQQLIDSLQKRGADGDYQVKEMDTVLNKKPSIERLYQGMRKFAGGKKGIVYAVSIDHARSIAEYYSEQGIRTVAIDSKTPRESRKRMVEAFRRGEIEVMVNVDVFSEGFDCPDVEFVQLARPTLSLAKYLQQVGRGLRKSEGKEACVLIDNVGLYRVFGLPVQRWNWKRMFCGKVAGKGTLALRLPGERACVRVPEVVETDEELEQVISHEVLLSKLAEQDWVCKEEERKPLKAWQDRETGLWGLRKGRRVTEEAVYAEVLGVKEDWAAVRFSDRSCGLTDGEGTLLWKGDNYREMKFLRKGMLELQETDGTKRYMDLRNRQVYGWKPEIKRFGKFELLLVRHRYYSRTEEVYASNKDFVNVYIVDRGFYLSIVESEKEHFCLLDGDEERFYRLCRQLDDGSIVVTDSGGALYLVKAGREKQYLGQGESREAIACLVQQMESRLQEEDESLKQGLLEKCREAVPYRAGMKWGLKVGNRVTIPPIYRNIQMPVGKLCAVEMNYSQWGVVAVDGTVLIEPRYPEVAIDDNGTVMLTSVTGKKEIINVKI